VSLNLLIMRLHIWLYSCQAQIDKLIVPRLQLKIQMWFNLCEINNLLMPVSLPN
jgi:hypothetical protein